MPDSPTLPYIESATGGLFSHCIVTRAVRYFIYCADCYLEGYNGIFPETKILHSRDFYTEIRVSTGNLKTKIFGGIFHASHGQS